MITVCKVPKNFRKLRSLRSSNAIFPLSLLNSYKIFECTVLLSDHVVNFETLNPSDVRKC